MARVLVPTELPQLKPIIEAMIFASEEPVAPRTLLRLLYEDDSKGKKLPTEQTLFDIESGEAVESQEIGGEEELQSTEEAEEIEEVEEKEEGNEESAGQIGQKELRAIIAELNDEYEAEGRPFRIMELAGGFQFATTKEYGEFVGLLSKERARRRLSPAALETLAIVAYRQPVTKPEVEAIRGVNCDQVLLSLLERNLITITGRSEAVGKPLLYGTTEDFLRAFGLNSLSDLPKLRELEELMEDDTYSATRPEGVPEEITQELLELDGGAEDSVEEDSILVESEQIDGAEESEPDITPNLPELDEESEDRVEEAHESVEIESTERVEGEELAEESPLDEGEEIVDASETSGEVEESEAETTRAGEIFSQDGVESQEMSLTEVVGLGEENRSNLDEGEERM